jgi:hypothetical protein
MSIFFRIAVTLLCSRAPVEQGRQNRLVFVVIIVVCIVALGRTARCRIVLDVVCSALFWRRIVECAAPVQVAAARFVECAHHDARRRRRRAQRQWCRYT